MERFCICKTPVYSTRCLASKPIPSYIEKIKELAANVKYGCCTKFVINGKPVCCCECEKYSKMTITDSTFEETCEGAIENGFAVVDGKKVKVMRIWEFCHFTYCVSYVIICDCAEAAAAPAPAAEEKKEEEEEEEEDLFGDDDEEEDEEAAAAMEAKLRAEAEKKKAEKEANKKVEKSLLVINIKPYDEETDLKALFEKIRATEVKGCKWSETCNIEPLAYGLCFLQISCVIEDDVCSEDDVIDAIMQFENDVQSTETASFNKIS